MQAAKRPSTDMIYPDASRSEEDAESDHILYYFPSNRTLQERLKHVGLAQALVYFGQFVLNLKRQGRLQSIDRSFSTREDKPQLRMENVHSQKHRLVFYEAEPGYWLLLVRYTDGFCVYHLILVY